ncbi:hypothetical protein [Roseibium sp. RKSG952]|uniref:hypothetical protein n=1 Tax=Roseibium sp. RKSG952 TaxID=2529384 RepID=UPI0012BCC6C7|nr:hypothetical protein [Roseibium sp. RKSG952]MTH95300.1 hypothetical protein [Roseibium sp. RKSG952]
MTRSDTENLKLIEETKPKYERLRNLQIRNEGDLERARQELSKAEEDAIQIAGTSNEDEIREIIMKGRAENTTAVDEWIAGVEAVERELAKLNEAGAANG